MRYSDDDILRMLRDGEERGMTALFERYYRPLVVFADTFLHDWEEVERLGVSVNTVKTLLRLGMKELRERMKGKEDWLVLWRWLVCRAEAEDGIMVGYKCMEQ